MKQPGIPPGSAGPHGPGCPARAVRGIIQHLAVCAPHGSQVWAVPIPSGACSRFLLGSLERPGRVGAMRRPALRAAPRAVFAVTAIRLQSLTPSRLRRCALRLPPGDRRTAHPRRAQLGTPVKTPNRLAPDRPGQRPPQWTECRATPWLAAAGCANACRPQCWQFVTTTSRQTIHRHAAQPGYGASTPRLKHAAAGCGGVVCAFRWGDRPYPHQGANRRSSSAGLPSRPCLLAEQSAHASLACRESWRGRGCALGFIAATVLRKQFPLRGHCVQRIPRGTNSLRLPVLHCVSAASGATRPSPA